MRGRDMRHSIRAAFAVTACIVASEAGAGCTWLSVADAESVLGSGVTDVSGEDAPTQCFFVGGSPHGTLIVQFGSREDYDRTTILQPHAPVDVGERGRSNVDSTGTTAVQFMQGGKSVILAARSSQPGKREYLDALIDVARVIAGRLD